MKTFLIQLSLSGVLLTGVGILLWLRRGAPAQGPWSMAALNPPYPWAIVFALVLGALLICAGWTGWIHQRPAPVAMVGTPPAMAMSGMRFVADQPRHDKPKTLEGFLESEGFRPGGALVGGGAEWHAERGGRTWTLSLAPQRRTRYIGELRVRELMGQRLRISVTTAIKDKLYVVPEDFANTWWVRWLYRLRGWTTLNGTMGHSVVTDSPEWATRVVQRPGFPEHMRWMQHTHVASGPLGSFYVHAGKAHYGSPILDSSQVTLDFVEQLLSRMEAVLRDAEGVPTAMPSA
jgi:hypothetical protein